MENTIDIVQMDGTRFHVITDSNANIYNIKILIEENHGIGYNIIQLYKINEENSLTDEILIKSLDVNELFMLLHISQSPKHTLNLFNTCVSCIALSADGNWIVSGSWDNHICIWNTKTKWEFVF